MKTLKTTLMLAVVVLFTMSGTSKEQIKDTETQFKERKTDTHQLLAHKRSLTKVGTNG